MGLCRLIAGDRKRSRYRLRRYGVVLGGDVLNVATFTALLSGVSIDEATAIIFQDQSRLG